MHPTEQRVALGESATLIRTTWNVFVAVTLESNVISPPHSELITPFRPHLLAGYVLFAALGISSNISAALSDLACVLGAKLAPGLGTTRAGASRGGAVEMSCAGTTLWFLGLLASRVGTAVSLAEPFRLVWLDLSYDVAAAVATFLVGRSSLWVCHELRGDERCGLSKWFVR